MFILQSKAPHQSPNGDSVSLRLGHATALTVPRTVIHYRVAASLPTGEGFYKSVGEGLVSSRKNSVRQNGRSKPLPYGWVQIFYKSVGAIINRPFGQG